MASPIDPRQPLPLYVQLKTLLLEEILAGKYGNAGRLPTEFELATAYSLSRTPIHRALAELASEGVILRQRRNGTFVNPHWLQSNRSPRELRVVVPSGPWEELVREACPPQAGLNLAAVELEDLHDVLLRAVAEGRAPDLALLDSIWVPEFAASGFLRPLEELDGQWLEAEYLSDVVYPFRAANRSDGQLVAVQAEADVVGLWYRRDLLSDAGLQPPQTWEELIEAGRVLSDRGCERPLVMPTGTRGGETTTYCLAGLMVANGASLLQAGEVTLDSDAVHECLAMLAVLVAEGVLPIESVSFDYDRGARLLAHGGAAMLIGGSYELRTLATESGLGNDEALSRFGFAPPPQGPRGGATTLAGGMVHAIFRQSQNPDLAMTLLKQLSTPEALAEMSRRTGQLAARRVAAEIVALESEFLAETTAMLEGAAVRSATSAYPRVSTQVQVMLEAVVLGTLTPAAAAGRAADLISAITGLPVAGRQG